MPLMPRSERKQTKAKKFSVSRAVIGSYAAADDSLRCNWLFA
jgi:hypothetical protein